MDKGNFRQIDLLRKRRSSDYLIEPYFIDNKKYIKKGVYSGLIFIAITVVLGVPFIFRTKFLESKKENIRIFSDEYDLLQKKLNKESKQLKIISDFNSRLKNSIINLSSSSALFQEIALIIPKDIQLLEMVTKGNSLTLTAKLNDKSYLETLNSFLIKLDKSELVKFEDIDLKEIKVSDAKVKNYIVTINTKVDTNYAKINENYLIKLGSYGLFNRLNLLKNFNETLD